VQRVCVTGQGQAGDLGGGALDEDAAGGHGVPFIGRAMARMVKGTRNKRNYRVFRCL
jgi:hypothetical protein